MTGELKEIGLRVGHRRVGRLMCQNGISVIRTHKHKFNIAPNVLDGDFTAAQPNPSIYPIFGHVRDGYTYLRYGSYFTLTPKGFIHHSDRGSQYCSQEYQTRLHKHGFKVSISGKGNCYDNAAMKTFFKTINGFCNSRRKHSILAWKSPMAFEQMAA